jgi:phosphoribosylaminoimidazolecarboxamide formyltransferase/IMP cyclohydrolase
MHGSDLIRAPDEECIEAADEYGVVFAHTPLRLFHH